MTDDVILPDDPRAAHEVYIVPVGKAFSWDSVPRAWESRGGHIGSESSARYAGSTHRECEACGEVFPKNSFCKPCADKRAEERYMALPGSDWRDGAMICDEDGDHFVSSFDEMADLISKNPKVTGLHWVFAGPKDNRYNLIDICDLIVDHGHEDFDFSNEAYAAADALEEILSKEFAAVLWPSDTRVTFGTFNAWLAEQEKADAQL